MSEMIERVAAVIAAELMELTADQRGTFQFPEDANGDTCDRARSAARAVIEAMREPTEGMVERTAMQGASPMITASGPLALIAHRWRLMIDEALK